MPFLPLASGSFSDGLSNPSSPLLHNMIAKEINSGEQVSFKVRKRPGVAPRGVTIGSANFWGVLSTSDYIFYVRGPNLFRMDIDRTNQKLVGAIPGISSRVSWGATRTHITVANGSGRVFIYNIETEVLAEKTFPGELISHVAAINQATVYVVKGNDKFYVSQRGDPANVGALDFATAEVRGDDVVSVITAGINVVFLGKKTTEFWYDAGGTGQPLDRYANAMTDIGCANASTVVSLQTDLIWIDENRRLIRAKGLEALPVGNDSYHSIIQELTVAQLATARAYAYIFDGESFYGLTVPGEFTIEISLNTGRWSTVSGTGTPHLNTSPITFTCEANNEYLIFQDDGGVGAIADVGDAFGLPFRAEVICPRYGEQTMKPRTTASVTLGAQVFTANPVDVALSYSDDGGNTYSEPNSKTLKANSSGQARWIALGRHEERILKFSNTSRERFEYSTLMVEYT